MELKGKLTHVLQPVTGNGKNGPWKKCDFVIQTEEKFPKSVCITAWKEQADQVQQLAVGTMLNVSFDLSSREYNGKWYTDVKAWKIAPAGGDSSSAPPADQYDDYSGGQTNFANPASEDDLPF